MDLRDRESFSTIIKNLNDVPQVAAAIAAATEKDAQLDREILDVSNAIKVCESGKRVAALGSSTDGVCRLHVFDTIEKSDGTRCLRIDAADLTTGDFHMSDFVSRIDVKLAPSGETVTWLRDENHVACDGITITRNGWKSANISVHVDYDNALFGVPNELGDVQFCNVTNLFKVICNYIKNHELSSDDDPSYFTPDQLLHKLLYPNHPAKHPVSFASLLDVIKNHFKRPGPFHITYSAGDHEKVFDIVIQLPKKYDSHLERLLEENEAKLAKELERIDSEIAKLAQDIEYVGCDMRIIDKLIRDPIRYMCEILEMPTGVVKNVQSAGKIDYTQMGTSFEFYKQPWAVAAASFVVNGANTHDMTHEQTTKSSRRR